MSSKVPIRVSTSTSLIGGNDVYLPYLHPTSPPSSTATAALSPAPPGAPILHATLSQGLVYDKKSLYHSSAIISSLVETATLPLRYVIPISSFKTFNDFFYHKLKPSVRPTESPTDPCRLISAADCRLMVFETVSEATKLWIKGCEFSIACLPVPELTFTDLYCNFSTGLSNQVRIIFNALITRTMIKQK
ncbi:hypothetical protein DFJ58DRAFT_726167 [Suillus subalutaceus]|uniref:uncharacterized protein n=1 Tax=Suillus subalutaceus TaxID=48586 RepID=UPI001B877A3B|nr:uncharacterized protein DFJ58DRAFT_726167 [Suillus subalutaceus]KAG1860157.1 hypothetical protein DFJ58DRAFT_726167 [Suillus subalutaceus]